MSWAALMLVAVVSVVFFVLQIRPSETLIYLRYSDYGSATYSSGPWTDLYLWPIFVLLTAGLNSAVAVKLHGRQYRIWAIFVLFISLVSILLAGVVFSKVVNIVR